MVDQTLPEWVNPRHLAEKGRQLTGCLSLSSMPRLAPLLVNHKTIIQLDLVFGLDVEGTPYLSLHVQTLLEVECQRCLNNLHLSMDIRLQLAIVYPQADLEALASGYEPLVQTEKPIRLSDIVEDELILAIPQAPMHSASECHVNVKYPAQPAEPDGQQNNPFAILDALKE